MSNVNTTDPNRDPHGRWTKGRSGNPAGRRAGTRNQATLEMRALLEQAGPELVAAAIALAESGSYLAPQGLKICLERLLPACRHATISLPVREIDSASGCVDFLCATKARW
jgi:hypothetical protein